MPGAIQAGTVAFCRRCGTALTAETRREYQGIPYCQPCLDLGEPRPASPPAALSPIGPETPPASAGGSVSPVLAAVLGFIPGVGAVYNGQLAKAVVHVVIFGLLISIISSGADLIPLFVMLLVLFALYMPLEAYRTARALERGEAVDEFSGVLSVFGGKTPSPAGGVALIVLGVVFLLHTLGYWRLVNLVPYWPVLLILLGVYRLYRSATEHDREPPEPRGTGFGAKPQPLEVVDPNRRRSETEHAVDRDSEA
jgi:hypothetical protein